MSDFIHLPIIHSAAGMYIRKSLVGAVVQRDDGKSEVYYGSESWLSPLPAEEIMALIGCVAVQEKAARTIVTTDAPADEGWRTFATFDEFCEWAKGKTLEARHFGDDEIDDPLTFSGVSSESCGWKSTTGFVWRWEDSYSYREVRK
jgi:hypothetical protein